MRRIAAILLAYAMLASSSNVAVSLVHTSGELREAFVAAVDLVAGLVLAGLVLGLAWAVLAGLARRLSRSSRGEEVVAGSLGVGATLAAIAMPTVLRRSQDVAWSRDVGDHRSVVVLALALAALTVLTAAAVAISLGRGSSRILLDERYPSGAAVLVLEAVMVLAGRPGWGAGQTALAVGLLWAVTGALLVWLGRRRDSGGAWRWLAGAVLLAVLSSPAAVALGARALQPRGAAAKERPPLVLLVTIDTLRHDVVGAVRDGVSLTPTLDRLTAESTTFTHARSPSPWTRPAVASLMTGLSPLVHEVGADASLPTAAATLAERLRGSGYRTVGVGTNSYLMRSARMSQGFESYRFFPYGWLDLSIGAAVLRAVGSPPGGTTADLTQRAVDVIRGYRGDESLFLWLHYFDPHQPYEPPPGFLPPDAAPRIGSRFEGWREVRSGDLKLDAVEKEWVRRLYESEVRYVDASLGDVVAAVHEKGLWQDSLVVVTSDHGEELWDHGGLDHGHTLYDELLRVPWIVKLPRQSNPRRLDAAVSTESLTPTLLDLLQLEADPAHFTSPSLAPSLREAGNGEPAARPILGSGMLYYGERLSLVLGGRKLIEVPGTDRREAYALHDDPSEQAPLDDPEWTRAAAAQLEDIRAAHAALRDRLGLTHSETDYEREGLEALRNLGYL